MKNNGKMEKEYIKYLKSSKDKEVKELLRLFDNSEISFEVLSKKINPVIHDGVYSYHTFIKGIKLNELLK